MKKQKTTKFDWKDFFTEANAKIVEQLLDKEVTTIKELNAIFFPRTVSFPNNIDDHDLKLQTSPENIIQLFENLFAQWKKDLAEKRLTLDPFKEILAQYNDVGHAVITSTTLIRTDAIISLLIHKKLLPVALYRLPRLSNEIVCFEIIPDYYEQLDQDTQLDELIKEPINYIAQNVPFISYESLKKRWEGKPDNLIFIECLNNNLGAYLYGAKTISCSTFGNSNRLLAYRKGNCGNPHYLKRYEDLEKLIVKDDPYGFDLKTLFRKGSLSLYRDPMNEDSINNHLCRKLQTTDLETKFHIETTLESFKGKNKIDLDDLVFLENNVLHIERKWSASGTVTKIKTEKPKQKRASALIEKIAEVHGTSKNKNPHAMWKELKELSDKGDDVIQDVDNWTKSKAKIHWKTHTGKELSTGRRRFQNIVSELNNPR